MPPGHVKALAYITHRDVVGDRLLVFRHPAFPEAGIQVPGGTVRPGEDPGAAALREAAEETGLPGLTLCAFLGTAAYDRRPFGGDGVDARHFYHLRYAGTPPRVWRHAEMDPSDGSPAPIVFAFYWARLPDGIPPLIADHGACLPELLAALAGEAGR